MVLNCRVTPMAESVTPDAWLYSGKIESVAIMNGVTPEGWQKPIEVGVKLYLEQGNLQFQPEILLAGNVKRDPQSGEVQDWGGAFPVRDLLFNVAGYDGPIGDDLDLPVAALKMLQGKTIHYVRYKSAKTKADGSNSVFTYKEVAATKDAMIARWKKQVSKGYPKDYIHAPQVEGVSASAPAPVF